MIRYILVDDEPKTLKNVKSKIDRLPKDYDLQHIRSYHSSKEALENINKDEFDLLIVDFEMPVYNGIELAQKVANNKKIIFLTSTTNNEQKVINSLNISGYLSKPFDIEEFEEILKNKVIGMANSKKTYQKGDLIMLSIAKNKNVGIYPENIYFISSALISTGKKVVNDTFEKVEKPGSNDVHFYGKNSLIAFESIRITISSLETELANFGFRKINQSTLVNTNYIRNIDNRNLELYHCNEPFEISAKEKKSFFKSIQ